jgi:hypothetical protein
MYCPECGNDAGSAKFCPECGANLAGVKDALSGKKAAAPAAAGAPAATETEAAPGGPSRLSPAVIWGGFGALAVVVIIVVVMMSGGFGGSNSADNAAAASNPAGQNITADTSGSYDELVARANGLYDKGSKLFPSDLNQGVAYFAAASKVYAAAWSQKATDPGVGTDYAVTLFYGGDIPAALKQIDAVIKSSPDYQKAWLNKGIFVSHEGQLAKKKGKTKEASAYFDEARAALAKAVALDPQSEAGKQADSFMSSLPK